MAKLVDAPCRKAFRLKKLVVVKYGNVAESGLSHFPAKEEGRFTAAPWVQIPPFPPIDHAFSGGTGVRDGLFFGLGVKVSTSQEVREHEGSRDQTNRNCSVRACSTGASPSTEIRDGIMGLCPVS